MKKIISYIAVLMSLMSMANANENILFLTDIHFNPYGLCKEKPCPVLSHLIESDIKYWPQILAEDKAVNYKIETSNGFLTTGLANLSPIVKHDRVKNVFITGDILSHGFNNQYAKYAPKQYNNQAGLTQFSLKVSNYVLAQVEKTANNATIFYILGNNDGDHGDYTLPTKEFLAQTAQTLSNYLPAKERESFIADFSTGGYFSVPLNNNVLVVGVNGNVMSHISPNTKFASQQLQWLEKTLQQAQAQHKQVIMLQHIPYGIDTYKSASIKLNIMTFQPALQQEYVELLAKYAKTISGIYAGHFHADYMVLLPGKIPMLSTIAFNSMFGNNPGFKVLKLNDQGYLLDYTAYNADLAKSKSLGWDEEYSLTTAYHDKSIVHIIENIPAVPKGAAAVNYRKYYNGNSIGFLQPISSDSDWAYYYCALNNITANTYQECLDKN